MENIGLNELRELFLSFFESKGHYRLKSYPLIPQNDNSLLLINAGMAPLKPFFTGEQTPPAPRATSCQKCIRTPDIESVGKDDRHGTYFEMLGNFSFGDYFKSDACRWAWEFVTQVLKMPADRLYPSVFLEDDEAYDIWTREVGVDPSHVVRLGREDNFWEIGSGPCGPCSEIYFDRGEEYGCGRPGCAPGCDCDRYVEFWNLVFTQFNSDGKGHYTPLEKKNIDTGLGLERLACIMQNTRSIFDIDTIKKIRDHVSALTGVAYGQDPKSDVSIRIITDHARSVTMMVCDGVMPSNAGRGYVLRRLLRRAARHGRLLGLTRPFLHELCETVIAENEGAYPELREKETFIKTVIRTEEERFNDTIESGLTKLDDMMAALRAAGQMELSGDDAFRLYDTYGFPIDLTVEILDEQGMTVDRAAFDKLMGEQRVRAKKARGNTAGLGWEGEEVSLSEVPVTRFTGYDGTEGKGRIVAIVGAGEMVSVASAGEEFTVFLDSTPFYAESGGQVGDTGLIETAGGKGQVIDTKKTPDGKFMHKVRVTEGQLLFGEEAELHVDRARRAAIMRAHSATHLLQKALRTVLGDHVEQAGSLVEPDKLRFDFTHFAAVTPEQMIAVENMVNDAILDDLTACVREMPIDEAKKLGAMALFGEKYGNEVRVVSMGDYSIELCGGTHVPNTARIGGFKITSEASVAAGVRRIEAFCGKGLLSLIYEMDSALNETAHSLKTTPADLARKAAQMTGDLRELAHKNEELSAKLARFRAIELLNFAKAAGSVNVLAVKVDETSAEALRSLSDSIRDRAPNMVAVLAMVTPEGKVQFAAACGTEAVKKGAHAGNIVRELAKMCGGGGGGRPDSATAGGRDASQLEKALESVNNLVENMLK